MRAFTIVLGFFLLLGGATKETSAETIDPHELFERRCARCHGQHAGEFVPSSLVVQEGELVGRENGKALTAFLASGHGRLGPDEIEPMVAHLAAILERSGLFREKCLICHGRAVAFARDRLILFQGRPMGRYTGRDVEAFLRNHGRLGASQVTVIVQMLRQQLKDRDGK